MHPVTVTCRHCGSTEIRECTLVPREVTVTRFERDADGTLLPVAYGDDEAYWEAEEPEPAGRWRCRDCEVQGDDILDVRTESAAPTAC